MLVKKQQIKLVVLKFMHLPCIVIHKKQALNLDIQTP